MDLPVATTTGYTPVGVEFVCPSVTSDGFYELAGAAGPPSVAAARGATGAVQATNPWIRYLDGVGHGWTLVDVTPERVQADFHLTPDPTADRPDPRIDPTVEPSFAVGWQTMAGSRRVSKATSPIGERSDEPR